MHQSTVKVGIVQCCQCDSHTKATARLDCKTKFRTFLFPHLSRLKARTADVSLAAHVLAHVSIQHAVTGVVGRARSAEVRQ